MMFHEELRKSLDEMNCTQKELAEAGNLPASTVNRYVSGKRVPEQRSEQLEKILDGLQILSNRKKYTGFSRENFYKILEKQLEITSFDYERFRKNLNMLIDTLEIKVSKMTKELYYEPSYIQRIKSGQRRQIRRILQERSRHIFWNIILRTVQGSGSYWELRRIRSETMKKL